MASESSLPVFIPGEQIMHEDGLSYWEQVGAVDLGTVSLKHLVETVEAEHPIYLPDFSMRLITGTSWESDANFSEHDDFRLTTEHPENSPWSEAVHTAAADVCTALTAAIQPLRTFYTPVQAKIIFEDERDEPTAANTAAHVDNTSLHQLMVLSAFPRNTLYLANGYRIPYTPEVPPITAHDGSLKYLYAARIPSNAWQTTQEHAFALSSQSSLHKKEFAPRELMGRGYRALARLIFAPR